MGTVCKCPFGGDLDQVLHLRKIGVRVAESPDDFSRMLASLIEDRSLGELKSRQINPDALVRYVHLAEVVEKCGPLIEGLCNLQYRTKTEWMGFLGQC